jgi:hypothetical protein
VLMPSSSDSKCWWGFTSSTTIIIFLFLLLPNINSSVIIYSKHLTLHHYNRIHIFFNCCLSVHVDNYTIIIPTKCTRNLLLKSQDITICNFVLYFCPYVSTHVGHLQGAQCQCLAKVIIDYNLLKLR